jgi:hypothetical protein
MKFIISFALLSVSVVYAMPTQHAGRSGTSACCKVVTAAMALVPVAGSLRGTKDDSKKYDLLNPDSKSAGSKFTNDQLYDSPFSITGKPQELGTPHQRGTRGPYRFGPVRFGSDRWEIFKPVRLIGFKPNRTEPNWFEPV